MGGFLDRYAYPAFVLIVTSLLVTFVGGPQWAATGFSFIAFLIAVKGR